jgi:hypothetical protein
MTTEKFSVKNYKTFNNRLVNYLKIITFGIIFYSYFDIINFCNRYLPGTINVSKQAIPAPILIIIKTKK